MNAQAIVQRKQQKFIKLERLAAEDLQTLSGKLWKKINNLSLSWALNRSEVEATREEGMESLVQRRELKLSQVARVIEDGLSSQNEKTFPSMDASVAIRIDNAKEATSTVAFEALKTAQIVDEVRAESLCAMKVERIAKEYTEK